MAGNAFTKQYLSKLIEQRIAQIEGDAGYTPAEIELVRARRANILAEAKAVLTRRSVLNELAEIVDSGFDYADIERSSVDDEEVRNKIIRLRDLVAIVTSSSSRNQRVSYQEVTGLEQRAAAERKARGGHNPTNEIARLKRVQEYITESPAEEFSLSLMQRLGFLDIIKSAINE